VPVHTVGPSGAYVCGMGDNRMSEGSMALSTWSTPMLKGRLIELVREMKVKPMGKNTQMTEVAEWVVGNLASVASQDPRTPEAVAIATHWLRHQRA
jgi:hypothetical protein